MRYTKSMTWFKIKHLDDFLTHFKVNQPLNPHDHISDWCYAFDLEHQEEGLFMQTKEGLYGCGHQLEEGACLGRFHVE